MARSVKIVSYLVCILLIATIFGRCAARAEDMSEQKTPGELVVNEEDLKINSDYLIVVNRDRPYEFGGSYDIKLHDGGLVELIDSVYGSFTGMEKLTLRNFQYLQRYLSRQGIIIGFFDGYRDYSNQSAARRGAVNNEWLNRDNCALPYFSEHHTGLVVSLAVWHSEGGEHYVWHKEEPGERTPDSVFEKIHEALPDFGFIERYPDGKEELTGVEYRPYEIRFVGSPKLAHEIMDNNLCLEEYTGKVLRSQPWSEEVERSIARLTDCYPTWSRNGVGWQVIMAYVDGLIDATSSD